MKLKKNRPLGLLIISFIYLISIVLALLVSRQLNAYSLVQRIFWADLTATVFIYLVGVLLNNATVYDPYWSLAPIVIGAGLIYSLEASGYGVWLLMTVICLWGIRLTANWVYTFRDLNHQDWRYDMFKENFPRAYPLISLGGIHIFPTVVVFLAMIPAIHFLTSPTLNILTITAAAICIAATVLQGVADVQMHRFRKQRTSRREIIQEGLWKYARHPNYLAEILFWWGVYLFLISTSPQLWQLGIGALLNTLMFVYISIPMAEKRLANEKDGYEAYAASTRILLPLKRFS